MIRKTVEKKNMLEDSNIEDIKKILEKRRCSKKEIKLIMNTLDYAKCQIEAYKTVIESIHDECRQGAE